MSSQSPLFTADGLELRAPLVVTTPPQVTPAPVVYDYRSTTVEITNPSSDACTACCMCCFILVILVIINVIVIVYWILVEHRQCILLKVETIFIFTFIHGTDSFLGPYQRAG